MSWRMGIGIAFLCWQLAMIVHARFVDTRYFCWAPHDTQTEYVISVFIDGRELSDAEVENRYRKGKRGRDVRSPGNVTSVIKQYEQTYGRNDHARVVMKYKVNGIPQKDWIWPAAS